MQGSKNSLSEILSHINVLEMLNSIWISSYKTIFTYQVLYDLWMYNYQTPNRDTIHSVFHYETKSNKLDYIK